MHRFAITFHRQLHAKNSLSSRLDSIQGVGPKTRNKLLHEYGSLNKISVASIEDLQKHGVSKRVAQTIKISLAAQTNGNS